MGNDLLAILKFRNLALHERLSGYTHKQLALAVGCSSQAVSNLLTLRSKARWPKSGDFKPTALQISAFFNVPPNELFPESLDALTIPRKIEKTFASEDFVCLGAAKSIPMLPDWMEERIDSANLKNEVASVLKTLTARERRVLSKRFGLDDGDAMSLEQIAQSEPAAYWDGQRGKYAVGKERIRQIESKALRKMRHPKRASHLRPYLFRNERLELNPKFELNTSLLAEFVCPSCHLVYSLKDLSFRNFVTISCHCKAQLHRISDGEMRKLGETGNFYFTYLVKPDYCQICMHHKTRHFAGSDRLSNDGYKIMPTCSICGDEHEFKSAFTGSNLRPYR